MRMGSNYTKVEKLARVNDVLKQVRNRLTSYL